MMNQAIAWRLGKLKCAALNRAAPSQAPPGSSSSGGVAPCHATGVQRPAVLETNAGNDKGQPGVQRPIPAVVMPVRRRPASKSNAEQVRIQVVRGKKKQTRAGLKSQHLVYSEHTGKLISWRRSEVSKAWYKGSKLELWNIAKAEAMERLGIRKRWVGVNGQTDEGKRLYELTHAILRSRSSGEAPCVD